MSSSPSKTVLESPLTISALLNSLHTHLQTQTQLLPTLHAQLGLPPSALADELSALQQRLTECVEAQIETRREDVETWLKKCDDIEKECTRFSKALGSHGKKIGTSIGELRKQQVLPVRHEMLNQHFDKLAQEHRSQVDLMAPRLHRLTTLSQTLGKDFFPPDILDLPSCHGDESGDSTSLQDVTPERFSKIKLEIKRGTDEISRRRCQLSALFFQMECLYNELDIQPPSCDDHESSSTLTLPQSHQSLSLSIGPSDPFMSSVSSMSTPTPLSRNSRGSVAQSSRPVDYHRIFALFLLRLDEAESEGREIEAEDFGVDDVDPASGLISWAVQAKAELESIKQRREARIQDMYNQLETLWRRLGVDEEDMDAFVENNRGSSEEIVQSYQSELDRMLALKKERMSVFIENARAEIMALWEELMVGAEEQADFVPFVDDEHTEELLTIHEDEIKRLKVERRLKATLLANIKKYFEICDEEKELAAASMDQSRLLGRGPRDPGRLLREEKMRKRVTREKPKLEQDLLQSLPAWEHEHGKAFLVNGLSMIDILYDSAGAADKENARKKPRAGSVPPRAKTPSYNAPGSSSSRQPHSRAVTPGARPGSSSGSSHSVPNKRAKLTSSCLSAHGYEGSHEPLPHRAPFSSRNGVTNSVSQDEPATFHKGRQTPTSSLPRPVTGGKTLYPSVPPIINKQGHGNVAGIGLGYPSVQQHHRVLSSSSIKTGTSLQGRCASGGSAPLQPVRSARSARRESFRPRPSIDGHVMRAVADGGGGRYQGGGLASSVMEEDEY